MKKKVITIIQELMEDDVDGFYLYHPELLETITLHGDQISAVGNYDTDGWKFDLNNALRQTLYVLMAEDPTYRNYLIFVTDRLTSPYPIKKALDINQRNMIDAHFILIGIGQHYAKSAMSVFKNSPNVTYIHVDDVSEIEPSLFKRNDEQELQCEAAERTESIQCTSGHCDPVSRTIQICDGIDAEHISSDPEQLLSVDISGRQLTESIFRTYCTAKCDQECTENQTTECAETDPIQ